MQAEKAEDLLERTLNDVQEIVNVTKASPTEDHALHHARLEAGDAAAGPGRAEGGKLDMSALMKAAMATPGDCGAQEGCAQVCAEAGQGGPLALGGGAGAGRVRDLDSGEGIPAGGAGRACGDLSADEAGEDPKGKSKQAEPGRPAIIY